MTIHSIARFGQGMCEWFWILLLTLFFLHCVYECLARLIPPPYWYFSRRKRDAIRIAIQHALEAGEWVCWPRSRVVRDDGERCFVIVQVSLRATFRYEGYRLYVVWFTDDRVDDLGNWTGWEESHKRASAIAKGPVTVFDAIEAYERCCAEGRPFARGCGLADD